MKIVTNKIILNVLLILIFQHRSITASPELAEKWKNRVLVENGGFEFGEEWPHAWTPPEGTGFSAVWDTNNVFSGKHSISLSIEKFSNRTIQWSSDKFKVIPQSILEGELAVKVRIAGTSGSQSDGCRVLVHFFDKKGSYIRNRELLFSPKNTNWKKFRFSVKVPPNADSAVVAAGATGTTGDFYFDDLVLYEKTSTINILEYSLFDSSQTESNIPIIIPKPESIKLSRKTVSWPPDYAIIKSSDPDSSAINKLKDFLNKSNIKQVSMNPDKTNCVTAKFIFQSLPANNTKSSEFKNGYGQRYHIKIAANNTQPVFTVTANPCGEFYAVQTLIQWLDVAHNSGELYCGDIFDKPVFKNRVLISGGHSLKRLDFMVHRKMNMILLVGAPHSTGWFRGLTDAEKAEHITFLSECKRRFIIPVPSIHPGYYRKDTDSKIIGNLLHFSDDSLFEGLIQHIRDLYDIGYRTFSIAWDDMGRHGGQDKFLFEDDKAKFTSIAEAHRIFTEKVYRRLSTVAPDMKLWTIGMSYWLDGSKFDNEYLKEFGRLPKDIRFISCGTMDSESASHHKALTGRGAIIWDNSAGLLDADFVEPLKISQSRKTELLTDTYMFTLNDRDMVWDMIGDYLWNGSRISMQESAKRSVIKMTGSASADIVQRAAQTISRLNNAPIPGDNSQEKLAVITNKMLELDEFKKDLKSKIDETISKPFIVEINKLKRELQYYKDEFKNNNLPLKIAKFDSPPEIDGELNDICWMTASELTPFRLILRNSNKSEPAFAQTIAKMGWDDKNLYIAFKFFEPEIKAIKAFVKKRDELVYHDDCVEIFLDPDRTGESYYQITANSIGTIYDYFVNREPWNGNINIATSKSKSAWFVEMSISFKSLKAEVKPGTLWNFNLCRERYAGAPEFSSWALLMRRFHEPNHFWTLMFCE